MPAGPWNEIRELNGSQADAFEELCCQFAHAEPLPDGSRFVSKGRPDSGIECYWELPTGEEWGWQAKFFTEGMNDSRWTQCDDSVQKALKGHPKLSRLVFCIPHKFPDSRRPGHMSARQRWEERRVKWTKWAKNRGMSVEYVLWDEHELLLRLSRPEHRGRCWFWFDSPAMDLSWFQRNVTGALSLAQDRYSPELHFDLPLAQHFEALTRLPAFMDRLEALGSKLNKSLAKFLKYASRDDSGYQIDAIGKSIGEAFSTVNAVSLDPNQAMNFSRLATQLQSSIDLVGCELRRFWKQVDALKNSKQGEGLSVQNRYHDFSDYELRDLASCIRELKEFCTSTDAKLADCPAMLLTGEAGSGKTHLACSVADMRIAAGLPTILLLGEQFQDSEPWNQIIHLTGLSCDRDTFLGALNASGEVANTRCLMIIDALNDGPGIRFWSSHLAAMLDHLRSFPYVALVVSVRSTYLDDRAFPQSRFVAVVHRGFTEISAEATRHFFRHYGLAEPNVPLLDPEFDSPLFLKLICQALKNSASPALPSDLIGVSAIFRFVLEDIDQRLAIKLDYSPGDHFVHKAVNRIAELMGDSGSELLSLEVAKRELTLIYPANGYSRSLLLGLISEHVLIRVPGLSSADSEYIRFAYQRLSDHLIVRNLLERTPKGSLSKLFEVKGVFGQKMGEGSWLYGAAGWLEALAIQLPEFHGLEIDQVVSFALQNDVVRRAFISSVIWRSSSAFSHDTEKRIQKLLRGDHSAEMLEALVCTTARPDHPYNADWLDGILRPMKMADRDASWSIYLFGQADAKGNACRLIHWARAEREIGRFPDDVVRLASVTLVWCLTTSDRFVRDLATKALVSLLEQRIPILHWLLNHFSSIEEPYLQERLYAVAYGCAMLTQQTSELGRLAQDVYNRIFRGGFPPASVLLRDHARGVIDRAVYLGLQIDHEPALIIPPYKSRWPKPPPSLTSLAKQFKAGHYDETHGGLSRIYDSVTGDDFLHYVINDVDWWSDRRRKGGVDSSPRAQFDRLLTTLSSEDAETLKAYARCLEKLYDPPAFETNDPESKRTRHRFVQLVEEELPRILGRAESRRFHKQIVPYLKDPRYERRQRVFSLELFQRLILRRVLELGWTCELFNDFDRDVDPKGRDCHKAERVGKKYQWIAYDEFHARISDNFGLAEKSTSVMSQREWITGTWPDSFRDIDPSLLLEESLHDGWGVNQTNWWTPHNYSAWTSASTPIEWLQQASDLPPPSDFLHVTGPDKQEWMNLNSYAHWKRKPSIGDFDGREPDSQELHYIFRSYLVKREHLPSVVSWGNEQDWINERLPSADEYYNVYFQERFWSPRLDWPLDEDWIEHLYGGADDLPFPVLQTTCQFTCENQGYDCSVEKGFTISTPSRCLAKRMGLRISGRRGDFVNHEGQIVAFDPSVRERGHSTLLIHREALRKFMDREKLALIWTLLGEKNIYPPGMDRNTWLGRLTILGVYWWDGSVLDGSFRTEFFKGHS